MSFKTTPYVFKYCADFDFKSLVQYIGVAERHERQRLCFVSTSHSRIYLWWYEGELKMIPYVFENSAWRQLHAHQYNLLATSEKILESEQELIKFLEYCMAKQFRESITSYYDELPSCAQVKSNLSEGDTAATLREQKFSVYETAVQRDPEWDGAVEVLCGDGVLVIPYTASSEDPDYSEKKLLIQYATAVPDSRILAWFGRIGKIFGKVLGLLSNIHISDVRYRLDGGK